MEIQQHDGAVVEAAVISAGLRQASARGGAWGEGGARDLGAAALPPPSLYRAPRWGTGPRRSNLQGGRRPRGGFPPKPSGGRPHP